MAWRESLRSSSPSNFGSVQIEQRPQGSAPGSSSSIAEGLHEAAAVGAVELHRLLLGSAGGGDGGDPLLVVDPLAAAALPAPADLVERALDLELLEHQLHAALAEVDLVHQRADRERAVGLVEDRHDLGDLLGRREGALDEEVLDVAVLGAAEEDGVGLLEPAAGSADLLVVGDRGAGALEVDDEAEVGLVVAHAEGAGRDDALDLVAEQHALDPDPVVGFDLAGVGLGLDPVLVEPVGDVVGVADGQAVDDAAALELGDVGGEPGHALGLAGHVADLEPQRRPVEGAADRDQVAVVAVISAWSPAPSCSVTSAMTRSLAVAVVQRTAAVSGRRLTRPAIRR